MARKTKEERQEERKQRRLAKMKDPNSLYLTPLQEKFVHAYGSLDSETCNQGYESLVAAGYRNPTRKMAAELLANHRIKWALTMQAKETGVVEEITRQKVVGMLLDQYRKADESEDRSNAIRAAELLGKTIAMFGDRLMITTEQQTLLDKTMEKEALRLSKMMTLGILEGTATEVVPQIPEISSADRATIDEVDKTVERLGSEYKSRSEAILDDSTKIQEFEEEEHLETDVPQKNQ